MLKRERAAAVRLVRAYSRIWIRLKKNLEELTAQIEEARARGEVVNLSWLFRQERYSALLRQITVEIGKFADLAEREITKEQRAAVNVALRDSQKLLATAAEQASVDVTFNRLPKSAVENMIGFLGNGSPLNTLLGQLPRQARQVIADELVEAVALGRNPRVTARRIREALGGNLARALTISRTESLRAFREVHHKTFSENDDILAGWIWMAGLQRACPACIALHGTIHPVTERMNSHVNCRCVQLPLLKGQTLQIQTGEEWFSKQSAEVQRQVFGNRAAYEALKSGRLTLKDFVGRRDDPRWGSSYYALSARRALAGEGRFPEESVRPAA